MSNKINGIYHEKQVRELCALHALNNLFQEKKAFTKQELDGICQSLSPDVWINPHRSVLGLGNYDINVIMTALQLRGFETFWFDKRKDPSCLRLDRISGFILNVPSDYRLGFVQLPLRRRHWVTVRPIEGTYYNLDSKLESPLLIGKEEELLKYLRGQLNGKEKELFVVVKIDNSEKWLRQEDESIEDVGNVDFVKQIQDDDNYVSKLDEKDYVTNLEDNNFLNKQEGEIIPR